MSSKATLNIKDLGSWTTKWCIEARVIEQAPVNTFNRKDGTPGKIFSCDLMDQEGDSIRAKFWDTAADKWAPQLQKGKVFRFSNGRVGIAQGRRFSSCTSKYEITFGVDATIEAVDDGGSIKTQRKSDPVPLLQLKKRTDYPYVVDLSVVVKHLADAESFFVRGSGEQSHRRPLVVYDDSGVEMDVTLFGDMATRSDLPEAYEHARATNEPLILDLQNIQVREFRGVRGATVRGSAVLLNPDFPHAVALRQWVQKLEGRSPALDSLSERTGPAAGALGPSPNPPLSSLRDVDAYLQDCPLSESSQISPSEVWTVVAEPMRVFYKNRNNDFVLIYPACPTCRKKVTDIGGGNYHCDTCQSGAAQPDVRFMAGLSLVDTSASRFLVRGFHEQVVALLGGASVPLSELFPLGTTEISDEALKILEYKALWKPFRLRLRCRRELFGGEERPNVTILSAESVDFARVSRLLLNQMASLGFEPTHAVEKRQREDEEDVAAATTKKHRASPDTAETATAVATASTADVETE